MIDVYAFDEYDYFCMHENRALRILQMDASQSPLTVNQPINSGEIQEIVDALKTKKAKERFLLLDMRKMYSSPIHNFDSWKLLLEKTYVGILVLLDLLVDDKKSPDVLANLHSLVESELKNRGVEGTGCEFKKGDHYCYCGNAHTWEKLQGHFHGEKMDIVVDNDINQYLFQRIKTDEYPQMAKNYSSNVYTNRYFDAKKILSEGSLFRLAVYRMMIMIQQSKELFGQEDFDAFICASLTGACLAAGLSTLFNKPVVYLKNIGPKISADDERMINRIHRGKRYVFVFDFMCMGKEYERIKMICNLKSASISCCAGVSYYRFPSFEKADERGEVYSWFDRNMSLRLAALFYINAFEEKYYYCNVEGSKE